MGDLIRLHRAIERSLPGIDPFHGATRDDCETIACSIEEIFDLVRIHVRAKIDRLNENLPLNKTLDVNDLFDSLDYDVAKFVAAVRDATRD